MITNIHMHMHMHMHSCREYGTEMGHETWSMDVWQTW